MGNLIDVEGIGPVQAGKLRAVGVTTTAVLLRQGASRDGRAKLAASSGISETLILKWVNHLDLFRIKGVATQYAELLEAAGVDSVPELAQRDPKNLHPTLGEVNAAKKLVRNVPTATQVADWVSQAKTLPRVVTH